MRTTKHKLGYRLVLCLVVLMLFFSDSSDEQALGFSACYNIVANIVEIVCDNSSKLIM